MSIAAFSPRLRFAQLSARERTFMGAGAASLALFAYLMLPRQAETGVELAASPSPMVHKAAVATPPPPPAMAAPAPPASVEGIILQGVLGARSGGSAILLLPGGQQRLVRVGRELLPGLTLKAIGVSHAIIGREGGDVRLDMGRAGAAPLAQPAAPASGAGVSRSGTGNASLARETLSYKLGLQPVKSNGRVAGFAIKRGAKLLQLQRAGLRTGDVIVGVNGSALDEERMMELAWTIANSEQVEFEYVRGGRWGKVAVR